MKLFQFIPLVPAFLSLLVGATLNSSELTNDLGVCQDLANNLTADIFMDSCPPELVSPRINTINDCFKNITELCPGSTILQDASSLVVMITATFVTMANMCGIIMVKIAFGATFSGLGPAVGDLANVLRDLLVCLKIVLGVAFASLSIACTALMAAIAKLQAACS